MSSSGGCLQGVVGEDKSIYICKTFSHFSSAPQFVTRDRDFTLILWSSRRYIHQAGGTFVKQAVPSSGWS